MTIAVDALAMGVITTLLGVAMPLSKPNRFIGIRADGFRGLERWRSLQGWGGSRLLLSGAFMVVFPYMLPSPYSAVASCALYVVWFFQVHKYINNN